MIRVFLDANVLFAGSASPTGASALILRLALRGRIEVTVSRLVLREAERNLRLKRPPKDLNAFHRFLKQAALRVIPNPPETAWRRYEGVIHPKDVPVLAAAVASQAAYLVTLDRRHFMTTAVREMVPGLAILTPGDFLRELVRQAA
jgi:predicted nucleic acid-binding protein